MAPAAVSWDLHGTMTKTNPVPGKPIGPPTFLVDPKADSVKVMADQGFHDARSQPELSLQCCQYSQCSGMLNRHYVLENSKVQFFCFINC